MNLHILSSSILDTPSKTLLISIGENGVLKGATARAVAEKFGDELQEAVLASGPFEKCDARLFQRGCYNLIFGRPFDYDIKLLTIFGIEWVVKNALKICDEQWFPDIAISALTANYLPDSDRQINDIIHLAIQTYFEQHPESNIQDIYLVNYDREIFQSTDIFNNLQNHKIL